MVRDKHTTKNGHIMITAEDNTGEIKVLINKSNSDLMEIGKNIILEDIIGITGSNGDNIIFSQKIIFPDIPPKQLKKAPDESYAIFLSDLHIGSKMFLKKEFYHFLSGDN